MIVTNVLLGIIIVFLLGIFSKAHETSVWISFLISKELERTEKEVKKE